MAPPYGNIIPIPYTLVSLGTLLSSPASPFVLLLCDGKLHPENQDVILGTLLHAVSQDSFTHALIQDSDKLVTVHWVFARLPAQQ